MKVFRCLNCGWVVQGAKTIATTQGHAHFTSCPSCHESQGYVLTDHRTYYDKREMRELWGIFGNVPINEKEEIDEDFLGFPKGTDRFQIWTWFDELYAGGLHQLMEDREKERRK